MRKEVQKLQKTIKPKIQQKQLHRDGRFKTLTTALKSADLVDALKGKGPFTVFAPTDEAFAKLTTDKLNDLLKPENKKLLQDILEYHVYSGKVLSYRFFAIYIKK